MTIEKRQLSEQNDNFIMLPTVDFCFKELMQNKEVRKGILSALLGRNVFMSVFLIFFISQRMIGVSVRLHFVM